MGRNLRLYGRLRRSVHISNFLVIRPLISHKERVPALGFGGRMVFFLTIVSLFLGAYSLFVEPYALEVSHIKLPLDGLPLGTPPILIAHFSDLHCDPSERLETKLVAAIKREHPDLIFYTGDSINSAESFDNFNSCITSIRKIAPMFSVRGDWDVDSKLNFDPFQRAGILNGKDAPTETSVVTIHGAKLCIVGVEPDASAARAVDAASKGIPIVLLTHSPDSDVVLKDDTSGVDLICCGHTHGGQIAIPGYGALLSQAKTQRRFVTGLHKIQNTWIYTNRGIGMEGHFPRVRFCAKPELTIYELVPSGHPHLDRHAL